MILINARPLLAPQLREGRRPVRRTLWGGEDWGIGNALDTHTPVPTPPRCGHARAPRQRLVVTHRGEAAGRKRRLRGGNFLGA